MAPVSIKPPTLGQPKSSEVLKNLIWIPKVCPCLRVVNKTKNPFHKDPTWNSVRLFFVAFLFCAHGGL